MKKTKELQRATEGYMRVYPMAKVASSGEWGRLEGPRNEVWMLLHLYVTFLLGGSSQARLDRVGPDLSDVL